jgi:hypothetical protein
MGTIVSHIWLQSRDGKDTLYEVEYAISPLREGMLRYAKIPCSERPCRCPDQGIQAGGSVVTNSDPQR